MSQTLSTFFNSCFKKEWTIFIISGRVWWPTRKKYMLVFFCDIIVNPGTRGSQVIFYSELLLRDLRVLKTLCPVQGTGDGKPMFRPSAHLRKSRTPKSQSYLFSVHICQITPPSNCHLLPISGAGPMCDLRCRAHFSIVDEFRHGHHTPSEIITLRKQILEMIL